MSSDQQVAFDNWEEAAEQLQKQQQSNKDNIAIQDTKQPQVSDEINQQKKIQKEVQIDPKQILKNKIDKYQKINIEDFEGENEQVTQKNNAAGKKIANPVLKSDKDFSNYARQLAKKFDNMVQNQDSTIDDEKLSVFFQELTIYMYKNIQWKNLHEIQTKLKVLKKQRKIDEEKRKKQKEKEERQKKTLGEVSESHSHATNEKREEDLFGGAAMVNSKQEQQERKNKIITQAPKFVKEQEDDDFM